MTPTKKRWIITGANGYVGGELCKGLHHLGDRVCGVARAGRCLGSLEDVGITCHTFEELPSILSPGDLFVHCASIVGNCGDWEAFNRVNVDWALSLFDQAAERGASCFIYVSSVAALGYRNRPGDKVLDESSKPELVAGELYGRSKLLAEQVLQERARSRETRLIILRLGLIYGRRPFASSQSWFWRGIVVDPDQRIPLVHIDSLLDAVVEVANRPEAKGLFLVVDEEQPMLRDLTRLKIQYGIVRYHPWRIGKVGFWLLSVYRVIARILRGRRGTVPKGFASAEYYFQTRRLVYSTEKLRHQVGWAPAVKLEEGLEKCCKMEPSTTTEYK